MEYGDTKAYLDNLEYINTKANQEHNSYFHPTVKEIVEEGIYE